MNAPPTRILLLEDEEPIARATQRLLERNGYSVTSVLNGVDGLEAASTGDYDLCLLNVILPGLDGVAIAKKLNDRKIELPLIFLTGTSIQEIEGIIKCLGLRVGYVEKPPSITGLVGKIEEVLNGKGWM